MNELQPTQEPAANASTRVDKPATEPDGAKLLEALAPYIPLMERVTSAIGMHNGRALNWSVLLLLAMLVVFGGLAAYSLFLGRTDTAEKIIIALVSFLGGTALFGGGKK